MATMSIAKRDYAPLLHNQGKIYVASRASLPERPAMWRQMRQEGWRITSTWIDESEPGQTLSMTDLWARIHSEIWEANGVMLYAEPGDFPMKGALIEAGIAIGLQKPVVVCMPGVNLEQPSLRPIGSWIAHPYVVRQDDLAQAMYMAASRSVI